MADISKDKLKDAIHEILKDADLTKTTAKKVRLELEEKLGVQLVKRRQEIDDLVMDFVNAQENDDMDDEEEAKAKVEPEDEDEKPEKLPAKRGGRKRRGSDSEKAKKKQNTGAKRKGVNGFTRPYTLSPELANLMGAESMPRHEVVKKIWQIIKERNLYDPVNKQYAICDSELIKVMGVKRFRTFGMLKYLSSHFRG